MNSTNILRRLLLLPFALWLLANPLSAATFGNFTYTDNGATITIDDYPDSATGAVVIPGTITGKPVVSIGYAAFSDCSSLTSVTIPHSIHTIEAYAFYGCSSLTSESIPNSVTSIGDNAFANCSSMSSVTIPDSVTKIGGGAFYACTSLTRVTIPNRVTSLGSGVFASCSSLTHVTIPTSVTFIGSYVFSLCPSLTSVTIPGSVTNIGDQAFQGCTSLTNVAIPSSVTFIRNHAFYGCTSLEKAIFLGNAPSLGTGVFDGTSPQFTVVFIKWRTGFTTPTWNGYPSVAMANVPNISVQQPLGSNLADGAAKKSYGSKVVGSTSAAKFFTISNVGPDSLTSLVVAKDGANVGDFIVGPLGKTTLAPGETTTFKVTFKPTATGTRHAAIHIGSNDPNENPFDIELAGRGT